MYEKQIYIDCSHRLSYFNYNYAINKMSFDWLMFLYGWGLRDIGFIKVLGNSKAIQSNLVITKEWEIKDDECRDR